MLTGCVRVCPGFGSFVPTLSDFMKGVLLRSGHTGAQVSATGDLCTLLLDLWHAKNRVSPALRRSHPDFYKARNALNELFSKIRAGTYLVCVLLLRTRNVCIVSV